jgi:hypothetical protein
MTDGSALPEGSTREGILRPMTDQEAAGIARTTTGVVVVRRAA